MHSFVSCKAQSKHSAFTLIELLVVIAIIAILAAILFPVFAQAREKARAITCLSNMKEIGLGITMYVQDYDEVLPVTAGYDTSWNDASTWDTEIAPYIGQGKIAPKATPGIFKCPDDSIARTPPENGNTIRSYAETNAMTGGWFDTNGGVPCGIKGTTLASIDAPADTIAIAERPSAKNHIGNNDCGTVESPYRQSNICNPTTVAPLHSNGWNYTFADGHAKFERPEQTIGKGINGTGKGINSGPDTPTTDGSSYNCGPDDGKSPPTNWPCGQWTRNAND